MLQRRHDRPAARNWPATTDVTGQQVAWINGVGGALAHLAGALSASLIPVRVRAPIAFLLAGLANAATLAIFALGPLRPAVYFTGTVLFLFTIGAGYALFTAVALEFLGGSGKSGSSRYAIINSIGNLPVAYMSCLDGRGYALWGPRAMPAVDAIRKRNLGCLILLAHFAAGAAVRSRSRSLSLRSDPHLHSESSPPAIDRAAASGSARSTPDCRPAADPRENPTPIR